jgi:flagellar hook-basal body complex protein FliE
MAMRVQGGRLSPVANTERATNAINKIAAAIRAVNDALHAVSETGANVPITSSKDKLAGAMRSIEEAYGNLQTAQERVRMFRSSTAGQ